MSQHNRGYYERLYYENALGLTIAAIALTIFNLIIKKHLFIPIAMLWLASALQWWSWSKLHKE